MDHYGTDTAQTLGSSFCVWVLQVVTKSPDSRPYGAELTKFECQLGSSDVDCFATLDTFFFQASLRVHLHAL